MSKWYFFSPDVLIFSNIFMFKIIYRQQQNLTIKIYLHTNKFIHRNMPNRVERRNYRILFLRIMNMKFHAWITKRILMHEGLILHHNFDKIILSHNLMNESSTLNFRSSRAPCERDSPGKYSHHTDFWRPAVMWALLHSDFIWWGSWLNYRYMKHVSFTSQGDGRIGNVPRSFAI